MDSKKDYPTPEEIQSCPSLEHVSRLLEDRNAPAHLKVLARARAGILAAQLAQNISTFEQAKHLYLFAPAESEAETIAMGKICELGCK